jgi:prepilin-type N-terminal cleavage/methylation domain-containing protein
MRRDSGRRGATLVELMAALAVLATGLTVVGLSVRSLELPQEAGLVRELADARRRAILSGQPVTVSRDGRSVRFAPDGSGAGGPLVTDSVFLVVDRLTGAVRVRHR